MRKHIAAALIFLVLALVLTNPLALQLATFVQDKQDGLLNTWIMAWVGHALVNDPLNLFNTNIFFPFLNTLAYSEVLLPPSLFALPFTLATNNPILGNNLALLAMLWLDAFGMYLLVYDLTRRVEAGWVAGVIFAFNPFNLGNFAQLQLLTLGFLPLALLSLKHILTATAQPGPAKMRRVTLHAFLFALFFILQSLSSFYYALLAGFAVVLYILWWFIQERRQLVPAVRRVIAPLAVSFAAIAVVLWVFMTPYFAVQRDLGFERRVEESEPFSASLKQFTEVAPENVVYGRILAPNPVKRVGGYPLDNLFPGLIALALGLVGVLGSRERVKYYFLVLLLLSLVLALGPRLYLTSQQATDITLPYRSLYDLLPPLRALRAPVRFDALINLALAALAGLGTAVVLSRFSHNRSKLLALGLVTMIALEYLSIPAARTTEMPVASGIPELYKWLAEQPEGVVLEVPMMGPDEANELDISTQYFTTYHWHKTPDGYSGFIPPRRGEVAYEMENWKSSRGMALLFALGVDYLVDHNSGEQCAVWAGPVGFFKPRDGERIGDACVYQIPDHVPEPNLSKQVYVPFQVQAGAPFFAYLILTNLDPINAYAVKPTDQLDITATWSDGRSERVSVPMPLVTLSVSVIPLQLRSPDDAGEYELRVQSEAPLIGAFEASVSVTTEREPSSEIVLPASVELEAPLQSSYERGDNLPVSLRWLPFNKIDAYYSASLRLVDAAGNKVLNLDRQPVVSTLLWRPGEAVPDTFGLELPADLAPGRYQIEVLMYQGDTGENALLLDPSTHVPQQSVILGEVEVR